MALAVHVSGGFSLASFSGQFSLILLLKRTDLCQSI